MNVRNIPNSILSIEAVVEIANQSKTTISTNHPEDALLSSSISALTDPAKQAMLAIGSSQKQELTEQINVADRQRDRGFIGFRKHLEADQFNDWDPAAKEAANNLLNIVANHITRLHEEGLTVQSALMNSEFFV